jgi:AraC family transcriptional regulator
MSLNLPPGHFFGTTVKAWRGGAFQLSESVYAANSVLEEHRHARAYLAFVVHGGHRETTGAGERDCAPATVVLHPAGECHQNKFSPAGGRIFRLEIDDDWLRRLRDAGVSLDEPTESHRGPLSQIAARIFCEFRTPDSVSPLIIEGLMLEFATHVVRTKESPTCDHSPKWLLTVEEYLRAHAGNAIRLSDVARVAGVHAAHLNRVFRTRYGYSIGEYVRRMRVDFAAQELVHSTRSLADIASSAGFADQSHFSRVFVRMIGFTPGRYRRLHGRKSQEE